MSVFVFTGPSLSPEEGRAVLDATYLPPVSQGDLFRLARRGPRAIAIVDGYFDHVPAVWHKEILWAMSQGIHVYGAASMGALRAAELDVFGMRGVGRVYEWYRDGVLEDDDEVAVGHDDAESGYRRLSEAMVNIRATLERAVGDSVVSAATGGRLAELAKAIFYPERTYGLLLKVAEREGVPTPALDALRAWLPAGQVNQKRDDAVAMLARIRDDLRDGTPATVSYRMEKTDFWSHVMRSQTEGGVDRDGSPDRLPGDGVLEELRLQGAAYQRAVDQGLLRDLAEAEAQALGHGAGQEAMAAARERVRRQLGIDDDDELAQWLADNDVTAERFDRLAAGEAGLDKLRWARGGGGHLLDHLRVDGRYQTLRERWADKERRLRSAGLADASAEDAGLSVPELMRWYFSRLGPFYFLNPREHAKVHGFRTFESFVAAVTREYLYTRLTAQSDERSGEPENVDRTDEVRQP
ncbi:TfuA-like protein [Actinopolymorpha rutila]|uniref:TfuA-like core domain-containing protein n=1 Tax=Actinopolymorpha rutila TaxID=446787 RepID=A0A852ZE48_9ACTN|nr:TfuA-like protein [Actinopolymorpha rutila]NYH89992.1 hypothetical protein [Actinopolymorpha rutila]